MGFVIVDDYFSPLLTGAVMLILFTLGVATGVVPDFGPMRRAERRVTETGQLIDHVVTQLPYALIAAITFVLCLLI